MHLTLFVFVSNLNMHYDIFLPQLGIREYYARFTSKRIEMGEALVSRINTSQYSCIINIW